MKGKGLEGNSGHRQKGARACLAESNFIVDALNFFVCILLFQCELNLFFQWQAQFLPPNEFIHYNMFNNFFFGGEEDEKKVKDFMTGAKRGKLVLVMDPPFGGLMSILSESMKVLLNLSDNGQ